MSGDLKPKPIKGRMPVLQFALPDELEIDAEYQRALDFSSDQLIRRIAENWDWTLYQPLAVSRRADGRLFVIDGQHRLAAARLRGDIPQLPCTITEFASATAEAASFVALNQQRKPLNAMELFRAAVASGEEEAVAIASAMRTAGLQLAPHTNYRAWKPGMVCNVASLRGAWRRYDAAACEAAMRLLAQAWPDEVLQFGGTVWPGLAALCSYEKDRLHDPATFAALLAHVRSRSQQDWRWAIAQCRLDREWALDAASVHVIGEAWRNRRLGGVAARPVAPIPAGRVERISPDMVRGIIASQPGEVPMDRFDLVHKAGHVFCDQCDKTVSPEKAASCTNRWCKVRPQRPPAAVKVTH